MDIKNNIWRINSYFRSQLPASVSEFILRKLAFTYYLYKKILKEIPNCDLEEVARRLINAIKDEDSNEKYLNDYDLFADLNYRAIFDPHPFENRDELREAILSGPRDYYFFANDGSRKIDIIQTSMLLRDLKEEELLQILNQQFDGSVRNDSTPKSVTELALSIANQSLNKDSSVIDMTCSTGSFLLKASEKFGFVEGIEINKENALIAKMRLFANSIHGEIRNANCFEDLWEHPVKFDFVFAEFPWKMIVKDYRKKETMLQFNAGRFALSPTSTTDYFFMSAMLGYLKHGGIAITVVPLSTLSNLSDRGVRKHMVECGYVKEVIALPSNIFGRTSVATALVVMSLDGDDKIAFFDGSQYFKQEKRWINTIDVNKLLSDFALTKEKGECYFSIDDLAKHNYSFSPSHYLNKVENIIPQAAELSSAAEIFSGWQVPSAKLETIHKNDGTGYHLLQMSNVENGSIISKLERYDIPQNTVEKFKVEAGDVVISTKSLKVKSAVVDIDTTEPVIASGSIMVIRPKKNVLNPYYLVAYFESDLGKQTLELYQTGTVIPNLSINNVKKLPIPLLDYDKQVRIGAEYRDLRDLIKSEKLRLMSLEEKAKSILDNLWDKKEDE